MTVLLYLRACDQHERRWLWYSAGLVAFVCALLSKATSMSVPVVLLILNAYPLRRIGGRVGWWSDAAHRVYLELIPYGLLAAAAAVLSIVALHPPPQLSAPAKVAVSAYGLVLYLWKTIAPVRLSPIYEMPQHVDPAAARFVLSYVLAIALLFAAWAMRHRWPGVTAAFLAFVAIMLPMLGVVQNGPQIAADRYTYHAAPALAILAGAAYARFAMSRKFPVARRIAFAATLGVLGILTWRQTRIWHDSTALWSRVLEVDDESATGHVGLANVLFKQNRVDEAIEHARRAVAIAPGYAQAHNDLGVGLALQGRHEDAIEQYELALAIEPKNDEARSNWGVAMARRGDLDGAIVQYRSALTANPDNADAHVNWGNALVRSNRPEEAIEHYREALRIRPDHADAEHNWGVALAREGKLADAIEHFRQALALDPTHAEARDYLERALQMLRGA